MPIPKERTDNERSAEIKFDALKTFLTPGALSNKQSRDIAIKLYREIESTEHGQSLIRNYKSQETLSSLSIKPTKIDCIFCLEILAASDEKTRFGVLDDWATHKFGEKPNSLWYANNNPSFQKLEEIYAYTVLGGADTMQKIRELKSSAGITRFLRYPPEVLQDTLSFLRGEMKNETVSACFYSKNDHNYSFGNNFNDFRNAHAEGYKFVAFEWSTPEEFLVVAGNFKDASQANNSNFEAIFIAGHGNLEGIGWQGQDKAKTLDVGDKEIFNSLKTTFAGIYFKKLFIFACNAREVENDPNFISISETLASLGLADTAYASKYSIISHFHHNLAQGLVAKKGLGG